MLLAFAQEAGAQDLEPRSYANTPIGLNFLIVGYAYSTGGVALDASVPLEDAELDLHMELLAYARSFDLFGRSAKVDVIFPVAELSGSAEVAGEERERKVAGLGDQKLRFSYNFHGAPALTLEEYPSWKQGLIAGASLQVTVPGGQYNDERAVNLGSHRWAFKPEIGVSQSFGDLILELDGAVTFFTKNDDYLGERVRSQDPLFAVQGHAIYTIWKGMWAALDATYYAGGETEVDGVETRDAKSNLRFGGTLALPVSRRHSLKLHASGAAITASGTDFTTVVVAWQFRWGGGL